MRKIFQYILMAVAVVVTASCSNELDEALQPVNKGSLQFVVGDFPAFGEGTQTRVIGTQDEGKTAWENDDQIIVTLTSQKYGEQAAALTYNGSSWSTEASLSYLENETPSVSVIYAPCYEVTEEGTMQLRSGMQLGMTEYLSGNYEIENGIMTITFEGAIRTYSRLRIAGLANQTLTVTTTNFTPAGATEVATDAYTLTTDNNGNAFLYGVFAEDATVIVKQGDITLKDYTFTAEKNPNGTEHNKSYALDVRPVIDLSQYSEGETVEIGSGGRIIGNDNEYNLTLNVATDATVIFEVGTSGVKLNGQITVADGKTLTLLVEGNAEHTVLNLSMVICNKNTYAAIIGPGMGYSYAWTNMGKIIFTDVTQTELDEMIANWLPSDFNEWGAYALGRGYDGSAYKKETFGGVWVSDGNGGTVQIGNESGYYCLNSAVQ